MVVGVTGDGQAPAFYRIGEDHRGPIFGGVGLLQDRYHLGQIVAAQIADHAGQLIIADGCEEILQVWVLLSVHGNEAAAQLVPRQPHQQLVLLVAHVVNALAHPLAMLLDEKALQLAPVFGFQHLPAPLVEHRHERACTDTGHHAVQALTVQVHDPDRVAQFGHPVVEDGFPHIAFVQLGVADDGNEAV